LDIDGWLRGIGLEGLLLVDPGYGHGAVSGAERLRSLVLWNPWFVFGGAAFLLAGTNQDRGRSVRARGITS